MTLCFLLAVALGKRRGYKKHTEAKNPRGIVRRRVGLRGVRKELVRGGAAGRSRVWETEE